MKAPDNGAACKWARDGLDAVDINHVPRSLCLVGATRLFYGAILKGRGRDRPRGPNQLKKHA